MSTILREALSPVLATLRAMHENGDAMVGTAWMISRLEDIDLAALSAEGQERAAPPQESGDREGWQPIETHPHDGDFLIATRSYLGGVVQVRWVAERNTFADMEEDCYDDATHWMPLPPAPTPSSVREREAGTSKRSFADDF